MNAVARNTTRIQLELSPEALARLQRLKQRTDATSYSEVARKALRLNAEIVAGLAAGGQFFYADANGNRTEVAFVL